jgi:hypothetical protein
VIVGLKTCIRLVFLKHDTWHSYEKGVPSGLFILTILLCMYRGFLFLGKIITTSPQFYLNTTNLPSIFLNIKNLPYVSFRQNSKLSLEERETYLFPLSSYMLKIEAFCCKNFSSWSYVVTHPMWPLLLFTRHCSRESMLSFSLHFESLLFLILWPLFSFAWSIAFCVGHRCEFECIKRDLCL